MFLNSSRRKIRIMRNCAKHKARKIYSLNNNLRYGMKSVP